MTLTDAHGKALAKVVLEMVERAVEVARVSAEINSLLKRAADLSAQNASLCVHQAAAGVQVLKVLEEAAK